MTRKREPPPTGLVEFEAEMRALGRPTTRRVLPEPTSAKFVEHAEYFLGPKLVYVQALHKGGWRAFVSVPDNDVNAVIAAVHRA